MHSVFSVSQAGADYLREKFPQFRGKIRVARLGVAPALSACNSDQQLMTVVSCSFIVPVKRLESLIDALAELQARGRKVRWFHIGPDESDYAGSVRQRAGEFLEAGTYSFVGGLANAEVRHWLAAHPGSAFVNVSASEGVPVSIMEALSQGLPIIATDVGGNSETIDVEGGMFDGLLPANPTPVELADRLNSLLSTDDEAYRAYVKSSHSHWARAWSAETNFSKFAALLADLATPPKG
ncbi:glycosyltransferase [Agrococcus beijingensis]|uniref:glycosyltransferase n=1 Tax=Agrococcus beijingensis TaxID=3068634 RepID=UPI00274200DF|nr:glycosyltransferase [Agrococcus sp. REN33]